MLSVSLVVAVMMGDSSLSEIFARNQLFGESAYRIEIGFIGRRKQIVERPRDVFEKALLSDGRESAESA
jgi:hypothetical protein